jgi:DNA polymerase (family 10)
VTSEGIAAVFTDIARLLAIKGENTFKIRAYETGAEILYEIGDELGAVISEGRLQSLEGIGEALAEKIETLYADGQVDLYERLKSEVPPGLLEMLRIPGLGASRIRRLHAELGVESVDQLEAACRDGRLASLRGFGARTAANLLAAISSYREWRKSGAAG